MQRLEKEVVQKFKFSDFIKLINDSRPKYWLLALGVTIGIGGTAIQLVVPKIAQKLINHFSTHIDYSLVGQIVGLYLVSALLTIIGGTVLGIFGENVVQNLRKQLWNKLMSLRVKYFDSVKAGEMSSRLVNDSTQVKELLANTFPQTLSSILLMVGSIIMMYRMDWHMTLAMVIVVPVAMIFIFPLMKFAMKIGHQRQDSLAKFNGSASETLSEIRLVKSSNAEDQASKKANKEIQALFNIGLKEAVYDSAMGPIMMMLMMGMIFGLLAYGIHRVATGAMTIGTLMSFLMYLFNLIGAVPMIATLFSTLGKSAGSTSRIHDLLDEQAEDFKRGEDFDVENQTLAMEHVDFAYDLEEPILHDVSFEAQPNQIVAFAGPSGGGKSTIFSLLERFYEPTAGAIKIGMNDVNDVKLRSWRSQIGFVSQDSAIMAGTIRDNLTYGLDGEYTDEQLWDVLELAFAREFVTNMPDGLDTQVGERGVKVSGGQRQRLAIARAFLRNPKILMLDEATASLDSESEAMVQRALTNLMAGRTTLVIAHRLSTIVDADKIYFIEHGAVTGSGSHKELVASHELYAQYVAEQFNA
ncbi:MAG: ABC transporter ATP-binding protein/permease [Lactobacillaceae bacterium]|jgi:ATP-binding cassette subfamily B protein AbcA/BmrA|nr:ABC transporter ATP-binding protein/permease [Lactobacillaceae bacterium]